MSEQEIEEESPQQKAYLHSRMNCNGCSKPAVTTRDLANFIIMFWEGFDPKSGEPLIRDGVFEENGRISILKCCLSCGPKIKQFHRAYSDGVRDRHRMIGALNEGPLKSMMREIWPRLKPTWRLELGWEIMLPLLQRMKDDKVRKRLEISKEDEKVERIKWPGRTLH